MKQAYVQPGFTTDLQQSGTKHTTSPHEAGLFRGCAKIKGALEE